MGKGEARTGLLRGNLGEKTSGETQAQMEG